MTTAEIHAPSHVPPELIRNIDLWDEMRGAPNPFQKANSLRDHRDIFWTPSTGRLGPMWVITRADHLKTVLNDPATFTSVGIIGYSQIMGDSWYLTPVEMDPPDHTKFRAILNPLFSPKRMTALEGHVREVARDIVDGFAASGRCELNADFARKFPIRVFLGLMGWPESDLPKFNKWMHGMGGDAASIKEAGAQIRDWLIELINRRRVEPTDDVVSLLLKSEVDGRPLTENEILGMSFMLYVGGLNTVSGSLGYTFLHLARDLEHQRLLREDESRISGALEEILRVYPVVTTRRFVTRDVELGGVQMKKGDGVLIAPHFVNYDERAYTDPETIDFTRKQNRHLSFGIGAHFCVGNHLAKRELAIALQEFFRRTDLFRVADQTTPKTEVWSTSSVSELQLVWNPKEVA